MSLRDKSGRIHHDGPKLVWQQIAEDIESEISSGLLGPGAKLSSELELASQYGVARLTIRRAIKDLAGRDLLIVVHGRGTFVSNDSRPTQ